MKKTLKEKVSHMDALTKRQFFRSAWLTSSSLFGVVMIGVMFRDGVADTPKIVIGLIVFSIVSLLLFIHFKQLVNSKS